MYQVLLDHIRKFVSLTAEEEEILSSYLHYGAFEKKATILREGQLCEHNYFVLRGCCRSYVTTDKGAEQMIQFAIDNWWISDYNSAGRPAGLSIQAVEPAELVWISYRDQDQLFRQIPQLDRYFRIVFQRAYGASLMRLQFLFCLSGEERYHQFNSRFPDFVQRIPQYMLASYLGFTPEFLSKLRAKKK